LSLSSNHLSHPALFCTSVHILHYPLDNIKKENVLGDAGDRRTEVLYGHALPSIRWICLPSSGNQPTRHASLVAGLRDLRSTSQRLCKTRSYNLTQKIYACSTSCARFEKNRNVVQQENKYNGGRNSTIFAPPSLS